MRFRRPGRTLADRCEGYSFFARRRNPLSGGWMTHAGRINAYLFRWHIATWLDSLRRGATR